MTTKQRRPTEDPYAHVQVPPCTPVIWRCSYGGSSKYVRSQQAYPARKRAARELGAPAELVEMVIVPIESLNGQGRDVIDLENER